MNLALTAFRQIFIMLILLIVGFVSAKTGLIDEHTNNKLSSYLLFLITPIVIFMSFQRPLEASAIAGLITSFWLSIVAFTIKIVIASVVNRYKQDERTPLDKFGAVYSNAGFIGIPLVVGIFGLEGVFYISAYLAVFQFLNWTHGMMVIKGEASFGYLLKALKSPAVIAIILGICAFFLQFEVPELLFEPLNMLANMNGPLAMTVAGVSMAGANFKQIVTNPKIYRFCFTRLLLIPLAIIGVFSFFDTPTIIATAIIILASCPAGVSVILFAYQYEKDHLYATELVVSSTILSMLTIPLLLFLI